MKLNLKLLKLLYTFENVACEHADMNPLRWSPCLDYNSLRWKVIVFRLAFEVKTCNLELQQ